MKRSLGNKRVLMTDEQTAEIVQAYKEPPSKAIFSLEYQELAKNGAVANEAPRIVSKAFDNAFFSNRKVNVDQPVAEGKTMKAKPKKGEQPYDPELCGTEKMPLTEDIGEYMQREVLPHVTDAWVNETSGRDSPIGS